MTTVAKVLSPVAEAKKLVAMLREVLPAETRWNVEDWTDEGVIHLSLYAEDIDAEGVHAAAREPLIALENKGIQMVLILETPGALQNRPAIKTFSVR